MEKQSKLHYVVIAIIIIIIALIACYSWKKTKPYQVLTSDVYPGGATISLYKGFPEGFPKEVVLENKPLDYSGILKTPAGKTKTSVSYKSDQKMDPAMDFYKAGLVKLGWRVSDKSTSFDSGIVRAVKGENEVLISFVPTDATTLITFQTEK